MKRYLTKLWLTLLVLFANPMHAQSVLAEQRFEHLGVSVIAEHSAVQAGMTSTLAFRLRHDPHWHTYWQFPGDSGLPTKLKLQIGASAPALETALQWPTPEPLDVGGIHNVGYQGETWLLADFAVPNDVQDVLEISAELSWLVCKEECIPGKGSFVIKLPIAPEAAIAEQQREWFAKARDALPKAAPEEWMASFAVDGDQVGFALRGDVSMFKLAKSVELFVGSDTLAAIKPSPIQLAAQSLSTVRAKHESFTEAPTSLQLLWVLTNADGSRVGFQSSASNSPTTIGVTSVTNEINSAAATTNSITLPFALLLAFLGGLILNLMPCVLPVLSLKVLGLLEAGPAAIRAHGWFYSAGVISSFLALGGLLLGLRSAGFALGWGFQLQSPLLVAALSLLLFVLALSMSGLVHFGYGLAGLGQNLTNASYGNALGDQSAPSALRQHSSAFFSGVLACVVASPCTAPMMGTALGYALVQPAWMSLSVLAMLGLGLAAPMLLLAAVPSLARHMPKPGAWMQKLKQALALPMYLSAIWLGWVLAQQRGVDAFALLLVAAVLLALALIWLEQLRFSEQRWSRFGARLLMLSAALPLFYALQTPSAASTIDWQNYNAERLQELRARGEPVLVQMTAAWCVTCKLNERVAMSGEVFASSLRDKGVIAMKGDWTDQDANITTYLRSYGASGVPLVVLYSRTGDAEVLPQVLTPSIVETALVRAATISSPTTVPRP
jgi:thiol:disulfide interchange protein